MAKGVNIDYRKWKKKNHILSIIREYPDSSRSDIKEKSQLSMESVLQYVEELMQERLIYNSGVSNSIVGRKATWLRINPSGCYFVGVKFNVNEMLGVVMDFGGNIIHQKHIYIKQNACAEEVLELLYSCIRELLDNMKDVVHLIKGIGIGVPGYVDSKNGIAVWYVHIKDWERIPIKQLVEERFGITTYIEQSVKLTALALKLQPENVDIKDMLFILVGRGVGMVIISNNEICNGYNNGAGEIGHMFVADNQLKCVCGKYGCLETEASSEAILRKVQQGLLSNKFPVLHSLLGTSKSPTIDDFVESVRLGDPDSIDIMNNISKYIGRVVSTAVTLLNPSKLIFSGKIVFVPGFIENVKTDIEMHCPIKSIGSLKVELSDGDILFDAKGAAKLVFYHQFNTYSDAIGDKNESLRFCNS